MNSKINGHAPIAVTHRGRDFEMKQKVNLLAETTSNETKLKEENEKWVGP